MLTPVSRSAVQTERERAEGGGGVVNAREDGDAVQRGPAGGGQPDVTRGNPEPQRQEDQES